jgi:uncharacterized protein
LNFLNGIKKIALEIIIRGEELVLSERRALYWKREQALVIADMHLGKAAHFRQFGIPVSSGLLTADLERLSSLIAEFQPKQLIVAGDMFHHQDHNTDLEIFASWRNAFDGLKIVLVQGNHDRLKTLQYMHMDIELYKPNLSLHPFQFIHEYTEPNENYFSISGHIHPGVLLRGSAKQAMKLPCFAVGENQLVLPAFSLFTGLDVNYCVEECDFYAIGEGKVFKV